MRECKTGKRPYPSRGKALEEARFMRRLKRMGNAFHPPWRAYYCSHCQQWHLTKRRIFSDHLTRQRRISEQHRRHAHD